jgi:hypothetical protein
MRTPSISLEEESLREAPPHARASFRERATCLTATTPTEDCVKNRATAGIIGTPLERIVAQLPETRERYRRGPFGMELPTQALRDLSDSATWLRRDLFAARAGNATTSFKNTHQID